jgi:hypothetical protein
MNINSDPYQLMLTRAKLTKLERVIGRTFATCRQLRAQRDAANAQRDEAFKAGYLTGFKNLKSERNKAMGQAEGLLVELKQLKSTLAATSAEVAALREELHSARAERDAARAERDAARAGHDDIARTFLVLKTAQFEAALAKR